MAVKQREYLFSVNEYKEPTVITGRESIALLLVRLIMMEKGKNPLHPDMGLDIKKYRYTIDKLNTAKEDLEHQIRTYLPQFQNSTVSFIINKDKTCNIEITIDDIVYVYDSSTAPIPVTLDEVEQR